MEILTIGYKTSNEKFLKYNIMNIMGEFFFASSEKSHNESFV